MSDLVIQSSFNSGEWSPKLYARVDLAKYRSGAALLENFFVDYRGGASTSPGTKYILQCFKSATAVRLIPFQASFNVGYVLEFGDLYIRFFNNGSPILEDPLTITAATSANPGVFTHNAHGYNNGDWLFPRGMAGGTWAQLNGNYYIVAAKTANTFQLTDLNGNAINTTGFGVYSASSGSMARVYTIASPYTASELSLIKFAQNVTQLILCHPNHPPYILTLVTATNWTLAAITFGASIGPPVGPTAATTLAAGSVNYAYVVTSVDASGQESGQSAYATLASKQDLRTTAGTNTISWGAVTGAVSYNVYKADVSYAGAVPAGMNFGFIGNITGVSFIDSNIAPDYSLSPPIPENPFFGSGVQNVAVTNPGSYGSGISVPTVTFTGGGGTGAAAVVSMQCISAALVSGGTNYIVGQTYSCGPQGVTLLVTSVNPGGVITGISLASPGNVTGGVIASTPTAIFGGTSSGTASANLTWQVSGVGLTNPGTGYATPPAVAFSSGAATAVATLGAASSGNPTVPGFFQQRLVLAGPVSSPQQFNMSRPGIYFNYDVSQISQPDDAIQGTLISGQLNTIKSVIPQTSGLLVFTDRNSWLINGGSAGSAISPTALVANAQSFNGISDVPPIIANFDVLYVQAKGSIIRDSAYNIYANVYTGTDISAISSHLFYGFTILEWAWAEEPFKVVWAVRSDGVMLTLTFLKEQEFIGWAHRTTQGLFKSVATIIENTPTAGEVDAIYTVVQRTISGQSVKYIERVVERTFTNGVADAWCVDCGINYAGTPATTFSGANFLAGATCTGLADGVVIPSFVMPANGTFVLGTAASKVTVGLGYTCKLQTLPLEIGDPTLQGKVKKINNVDVRVAETLGLSIGSDFNHLTAMKDLVIGNVSSMLVGQSSQIVTDLVSGDARTILDPTYTVPGQYCIQQSQPLPATILGVIPDITVGDTGGRKG